MLVADTPTAPTQVIDVRDLTAWLLDSIGRHILGFTTPSGGGAASSDTSPASYRTLTAAINPNTAASA